MSDMLADLPSTEDPPSAQDYARIQPYMPVKCVSKAKKTFILAAALFVILSLPFVDALWGKLLPSLKSPILLILFKTILFAILLYILDNTIRWNI